MYRYLSFAIVLLALLNSGCGGQTYVPEPMIIGIYTYDENTNGISGLKVTFVLTTNGVSNTDIKYTDTNGCAKSKEFIVDYSVLNLGTSAEKRYGIFDITIEDVDGTNNGEFANTNFKAYDILMKVFMQRKK